MDRPLSPTTTDCELSQGSLATCGDGTLAHPFQARATMKANPMSEIDPVQFGKLINAVETLEENVKELSAQVQSLNTQITGGKGVVMGLLIAAGGVGAAITKLLESWLK